MLRRLILLMLLPLTACEAIAKLPTTVLDTPTPGAQVEATPAPRGSSHPASWEALNAGHDMIKSGRHAEAIARAAELKRAHPDDPEVSRLRFEALKTEAERLQQAGRKDNALWRQAAQAAEEAVALHRETGVAPQELPWRLFNAVYAYHEGGFFEDVARVGPPLIAEDATPLGDNWIFAFWYLLRAEQALGRIAPAREVLARMVDERGASPNGWAFQTAREVLRAEPSLTALEKQDWLARLAPTPALKLPEAAGLLEAYVWLALDEADARYKRGDYAQALEAYQRLAREHEGALATQSPALHDNLEMRRRCAEFRVSHPGENGRRMLKATLLTAQETDVEAPSSPTDPTATVRLRASLKPNAVAETLESFYWFAETWLAISDGGIGWTYQLREAPRRVVGVDARFEEFPVLQAGKVEPPLEQTDFLNDADSDLFYLIWPGTPQLPNLPHTINGGATIKGFQRDGEWQYRVFIMSDPTSRSGDELDDALYVYHELFHMLEWAYPEADFPKDKHPCNDRARWPADYTGATEWDFYQQTFEKRMMKLDRLDRVKWADNSNPAIPPENRK